MSRFRLLLKSPDEEEGHCRRLRDARYVWAWGSSSSGDGNRDAEFPGYVEQWRS